jgi:hypothetical protein
VPFQLQPSLAAASPTSKRAGLVAARGERLHTLLIPACVVAVIGIVAEFATWPEADVTWLLTVARKMAAGATLYSDDLVEVNPPLVMELGRLALWVGQYLGLDAISSWRGMTVTVIAAALPLSLLLLNRLLGERDDAVRALAGALLGTVLACLPGSNFGQREHLIALCLTPYALSGALYASGATLSFVPSFMVGAMLAVAVAIKPHYILVVFAVEAAVAAARARRGDRPFVLRTDLTTAVAASAVLIGLTALVHPTYFSVALPLALGYYPSYGEFELTSTSWAYPLLAIALDVLAARFGVRAPASRMLVSAGLASTAAYLVQGKGWEYHFVPARCLFALSIGMTVLILCEQFARRAWPTPPKALWRTVGLTALVAFIVFVGVATARRAERLNAGGRAQQVRALRAVFERAQPPDVPQSVSAWTLEMFPAFPVTEIVGADWASRFSCLWMIPAIEAHEAAHPADRSGRQLLERAMTDDLVHRHPTFVVIEVERSHVLDEIVALPTVQAALKNYHQTGEVGNLRVWVRDAAVSAGQLR